ncbi:MAG: hypothetical protein WDA25_01160 [Paracoccaceae bacterium]
MTDIARIAAGLTEAEIIRIKRKSDTERTAQEAAILACWEVDRLCRHLDITNADHIALWLEENRDASNSFLACRIVEAHEAAIAALDRVRVRVLLSPHGLDTHDKAIEMFEHQNCPTCGGSGHIDDVPSPADPFAEWIAPFEGEGRDA